FLHGLCCNEQVWWLAAEKHYDDPTVNYGSRLAEDFGYTAVYVRYNSGLHISDNGRRLASLLDELVTAWPVQVEEMALIGHSMGGLVARSACHVATRSGLRWPQTVRHTVSLGSPHLGAPLEQVANAASWALAKLPETRPVAKVLNIRSSGIKDLRYGYVCDEDWTGYDCDALWQNRRGDVPLLPAATHFFVGMTLTASPRHPVGRLLGDLLVLVPSASGIARGVQRIPFEVENGRHFGRMHHLAVLNHPDVYDELARWLGAAPRR
ncbi:MAG: lipase family alpha/beta hydrolase, partial [Haloechinothrix sp.]